MKYSKEKLELPNFKESTNLNSNAFTGGQLDQLNNMVLTQLNDDDYFLNTKDSVVYSYLMHENVKNNFIFLGHFEKNSKYRYKYYK